MHVTGKRVCICIMSVLKHVIIFHGFIVSWTEAPEEEYDPRSLYERLQEQKDKKQEEFEEQFKFSQWLWLLGGGRAHSVCVHSCY